MRLLPSWSALVVLACALGCGGSETGERSAPRVEARAQETAPAVLATLPAIASGDEVRARLFVLVGPEVRIGAMPLAGLRASDGRMRVEGAPPGRVVTLDRLAEELDALAATTEPAPPPERAPPSETDSNEQAAARNLGMLYETHPTLLVAGAAERMGRVSEVVRHVGTEDAIFCPSVAVSRDGSLASVSLADCTGMENHASMPTLRVEATSTRESIPAALRDLRAANPTAGGVSVKASDEVTLEQFLAIAAAVDGERIFSRVFVCPAGGVPPSHRTGSGYGLP